MTKTIIITGGGSGLGRCIARRFAAYGDAVIILGRTLAKLEAVAAEAGANVTAIDCDISDPEQVRSAFARIAEIYPSIDVLINNAGRVDFTTLAAATDQQIIETVGTNLLGNLFCSRAAIGMMRPGGHIINISSDSVDERFPQHVIYQSTKAGIETLSLHLQDEVAPLGLRVSVVRPGAMMDEYRNIEEFPDAIQGFVKACAERGIDLLTKPISSFSSATHVIRMLVDMPEDLQVSTIRFVPRQP